MTDATKKPDKPAKRLPTDEELIARGWQPAETPAGRGYFLPAYVPRPQADEDPPKPADPPATRGLTRESLEARGFIVPKSSGQGFGLPLHGPAAEPSERSSPDAARPTTPK